MKVYYISPMCKHSFMLFDTFSPTFDSVDNVDNADIIFFDTYSGLGDYDPQELNYVLNKNLPICAFDAIDYGGMSKETWDGFDGFSGNKQWLSFLKYAHQKEKFIYFMRKMDMTLHYPEWVYPLEVLQYPDHDFPLTTKEELFNRPIDICFIGNVSPSRAKICTELRNHFKCDFVLGEERIPHEEWLNRHRRSKLFISADGGGYSDERPYQLLTISPMLKQKNNHLQSHPFDNGINCVEASEYTNPVEINLIRSLLDNPEKLFYIYEQGVKHLKQFYNPIYRQKYILSILNQNGICL